MSFLDIVARARAYLQTQGRVSLRALRREFELDDEALEDLVEELVDVQRVAVREERVLAWAGAAGDPAEPAPEQVPPETGRAPRTYTPRHLADKILQSKSALEGERKQVTVMFADVKGSMDLAAEAGPEQWHEILDRFFEILSEGVHRFEGTVNQYTGDGIMALFGAPIAHEDHAQRACYASLHLRDALRDYADELRRTKGLNFSVRIGLNSGEVVVGKIGDDLRMDYTAQGHTVGMAQRMEQLCAADSTYLTEHTARLVEGYFQLRDLGPFQIKGAGEAVGVFELEGVGALRTRLELSRARGFSHFVGRSNEIAVLDAALERATEGHGGVFGVVADAGVGKSRLCAEFADRCRAKGVAVYQGHCFSHGQGVPLLPILELLREFMGVVDGDSDQTVREKVAGRLLLLDRAFEDDLPVIFEFMGVSDAEHRYEGSDQARQRQVVSALRRMIQARSRREPAVLLIDDAHWIDPSSDEIVAQMVDVVAGSRTLLLLNFRPEYGAAWMSSPSYQQLPLRPLGDAAIDELLRHLLGSHPSTDGLPARIRERTGGNPFYIEEVVQTLVETGQLTGRRGAYELAGAVEKIDVPPTVQAILSSRIDRLAERDKSVLQTAAAIGRRFPGPLLHRVCELPDPDLDASLAALRAAELIHEESLYPQVEYAFRHSLTHSVARDSQLASRRAQVHGAVARAIEELHADRLDEHVALLAHHWDEAGEVERAAQAHRRAAELIAGGNSAQASHHWERVRELSDRIDDPQLSLELGQQSRLMILEYAWRLGADPERTDALLEEGKAWAERHGDDRALASIYNAAAMPIALSMGDSHRSLELAHEGLRLAKRVGDPGLAFALELRVYFAAQPAGIMPDESEAIAAAIARPLEEQQLASPLLGYDGPSAARSFLGLDRIFRGELDEARRHIDRGAEMARAADSVEVLSWTLFVDAIWWICWGDPARAARCANESLDAGERTESPLSVAIAKEQLGKALRDAGKPGEARVLLQEARELARTAAAHVEPGLLSDVAMACADLGELDAARATAAESLEIATARRSDYGALQAHFGRAYVALASGDPVTALAECDGADAATRRCERPIYAPRIDELRARAHRALGDEPAAREAFERALARYRAFGAQGHVERLERENGA